MKPQEHLISSLPLAGIFYAATGSLTISGAAIAFSVLPDIDHLVEYIVSEKNLNLSKFYKECLNGLVKHKRIFLPLHSWELIFFSWVVYLFLPSVYLLAVLSSFSLHLLLDQIFNRVRPLTYFISYRIRRRFDRRCFFNEPLYRKGS